jgi:uncharacterized protein YegL
VADGGTPMGRALQLAKEVAEEWIQNHQDCNPPIVINFTDCESNDVEPEKLEPIASEIKSLQSQYGKALLFNLHISSDSAQGEIAFPDREDILPNELAKLFFRMSSELTSYMIDTAKKQLNAKDPEETRLKEKLRPGCRGFVFNGRIETLIRFLVWGTQNAPMR